MHAINGPVIWRPITPRFHQSDIVSIKCCCDKIKRFFTLSRMRSNVIGRSVILSVVLRAEQLKIALTDVDQSNTLCERSCRHPDLEKSGNPFLNHGFWPRRSLRSLSALVFLKIAQLIKWQGEIKFLDHKNITLIHSFIHLFDEVHKYRTTVT